MKTSFALAALFGAVISVSAIAADAVKYSADSTVGALLDNPAAKAVLAKAIPNTVNNPQIDQGRDMKLRDLQQYDSTLTDAKLKEIDADLAKVK